VQFAVLLTDDVKTADRPAGQLQPPVVLLGMLQTGAGAGLPPLQLLAVYVVILNIP